MRNSTPNVGVVSILLVCIISFFSTDVLSQQQFDVALTKTTITSAPVKYGTPIPFNITIYNQGLDTITNVEVIDHFGDGYVFQTGLNMDWSEHLTIPNAVTNTYTELIPPGENRIITVNLLAQEGDSTDDWVNTAEVVTFTDRFGTPQEAADMDSQGNENPDDDAGGLLGSDADNEIDGNGMGAPNDGVAATDEDDHDRDSIQIFDLALTKILDPITGYSYGDTLTFTTTVYNQGNVTNRQVRIRDIIPEGYINPVAENVAAGWSNDANNPIFTIDQIGPFQEISFELKLILDQFQVDGDAWVNFAEILSARDQNFAPLTPNLDADSEMASNTEGERSVGQGDPDDNNILNPSVNPGDQDDHDPAEPVIFDLALIKERSTALSSFNYGTPITYDYTVVNQGNVAATNIVLVDSLPCGAMFEQALNPDWDFNPTTRIATTTIAGLDPLDAFDADHIFEGELILTVIPCYIDQETAWNNYMEIAQATTVDGVQTQEIDGVFDSQFRNDPGGIPLSPSDNNLDGIGIFDEDNHDVELLQVYDLALKKELVTAGPYTEGQDLDFRIRVYNQGNVEIQDLVVEDFVPEGYGFNLADNSAFGWTTNYSAVVGGILTTFTDTLNVMEDLFLATGDSVDITIRLSLELDGTMPSDWYNYAHVWVASDTVGNNRFDDADSNPMMTTDLEFAVIPDSDEDDDIFAPGKSVTPQEEEDDHDVASVNFFDLSLSKNVTSTPTAYGQDVTFDIEVTNEGVQFAHDITITDYLPCGLTFDAGDNMGWTLNGSNPEFFFTDTIFPGQTETISLTLTIEECLMPTVDAYRNVAEISNALDDNDVTGDDQDSTPGNNDPDEDDQDDALVTVFDLALEKNIVAPPASFTFGSPVTYNIIVTNEGNTPAINTEITDFLPCGLDFSPTGNTGWTVNGANVSYTVTTLINPGQSEVIPLTLTIGTCTNEPFDLTNLAEITDDNDSGNNPIDDFDSTPDNGDPDEDDIDEVSLDFFDLSLEKTLTTSTASLMYNQGLDYEIVVTNEGTIPATSFTVTDYLACGLGFTTTGNSGWSLDPITGYVSIDINTQLDPGQSTTLNLTLILEECANPTSAAWVNVAEISAANDPSGVADDEDSTPDAIPTNDIPDEDDIDDAPLEIVDLAIDKSHVDPVGPIGIGTPVNYTITVTNEGNVTMTGFVVTDYVPCGLSFSTTGNAGWSPVGTFAEFTVTSSLAPGMSLDIPLTLTVSSCAANEPVTYLNEVEISDLGMNPDDIDSTPDDIPDNDPPGEDDFDDDPLDFYDLSLEKTSNVTGSLRYDDAIIYTITVTNEGSLAASSVEVTDYIPCGLRYESSGNTGWNLDNVTGFVSRTVPGVINPGQSASVQLILILENCPGNQADAYNNYAEISGGNDPSGNPGDDEDSTPDDIPNNDPPGEDDIDDEPLDVFDLSITKAVINPLPEYELEDIVTYNLVVTNEGNVAATGIELTDYIPCGMTLAAGNTLPWMIDGNGYAFYVYAGTINPGATQSFEISLMIEECMDETGTRTNVIEISDSDDDADSFPDDIPDNDPDDEDDNDDVTIDVNVGVTIGDFVFNDVDGDGIQDGNEPGIAGVMVVLYTSDDILVAVTETDGSGFYEFTEIPNGDYYIVFEVGDEYTATTPNAGTDANDSNVTGDNGVNSTSTFTVEGDDDTIDAGFYFCAEIKGVTYYDVNEDDIRQTTENGINGLIVNVYRRVGNTWILYDSETTHHDYDTPSDDGIWDFCVAPGQYYIEVVMPPIGLVRVRPFIGGPNFDSDINGANGPNTTPAFTLSQGGSKTDLGAGYYPMATVGNAVWEDDNFNGIQDDGEAKVAGVQVQVYNEDHQLLAETTTNEVGVYEFEYLAKESYYLRFEAPEGYAFTLSDANGNDLDELDSDVTHEMGFNTTRLIAFNPGDEIETVDAGIISGALPIVYNREIEVIENEKNNSVRWSTRSEINSDRYEVERRLESEEKFTSIGILDAAGYSTSIIPYEYFDTKVNFRGNYYYRIKAIDNDGSYTYSNIAAVNRSADGRFAMFPNPTSGEIQLTGSYDEDESYSIRVVNNLGQVVEESRFNQGEMFDISHLANGVYNIILLEEGAILFQKKVIKL